MATGQRECVVRRSGMSLQGRANVLDDRVKLPSDPTRTVKGVDVLPYVLSPLMGPEEYDIDVSLPLVLI